MSQITHCVVALLVCLQGCLCPEVDVYSLLMPNVTPPVDDTYYCTSVRLVGTTHYIVGFRPNATMHTAHHMLLYGCELPGSADLVWNCGHMSTADPVKNSAPICKGASQVIYAWAMDAQQLTLPPGVAFQVGAATNYNYLVLQVHYANVQPFKNGKTDNSGVQIIYTNVRQPKLAGVLLLGTGGYIFPQSIEHMEVACEINEDKVLHPFAFRTHTHSLGKVVSGWRVQYIDGQYSWKLIGKMNPQLPQMFYPVANQMQLKKGDIVAARCTMESHRNRITHIGYSTRDEMCNFYLMYWTKDHTLDSSVYMSWGPPLTYWHRFPFGFLRMFQYPWLTNIPSVEKASSITKKELSQYIRTDS